MNIETYWYVIAAVVVLAVVGFILVRRSLVASGRGSALPGTALAPGWQFYSSPTSLEPPGTVYRIDSNGVRLIVTGLEIPFTSGEETTASVDESVEAKMGIVARFMGLYNIGASGQKTERFEYSITNPVKEYITDFDLEKVMPAFREKVKYQKGNRYFVIREARSAKSMRYKLTRKQVDSFGGDAKVGTEVSAKGNVFSSDSRGTYSIEQAFPKPMRVMFLPEEIAPLTAGLGAEAPRLGLLPVTEPLYWEDD